jgi:hypothetical protein
MIDIYRIKFPKERLQDLTAEERSLFFLLGYAANQIAIFKKLTVFATNVSSGSQVRAIVEGAQSQIKAIGEEDLIDAQKKMHEQLNVASEEIIRFAQAFFDALLAKYFSSEIIAEVVETVSDAPVAFDVNLPFYVEPPDESRLTPEGTLKPPAAGISSR